MPIALARHKLVLANCIHQELRPLSYLEKLYSRDQVTLHIHLGSPRHYRRGLFDLNAEQRFT